MRKYPLGQTGPKNNLLTKYMKLSTWKKLLYKQPLHKHQIYLAESYKTPEAV